MSVPVLLSKNSVFTANVQRSNKKINIGYDHTVFDKGTEYGIDK